MNKRLAKLIHTKAPHTKLQHRVSAAVLQKIEKDFAEIAATPPPWPPYNDIRAYFNDTYGVDMTPNTIRSRLRGAAK